MNESSVHIGLGGSADSTILQPSKLRVINIGKDAIFEYLCEAMMENAESFFSINDSTSVSVQCDWDQELDQFTCVIESAPGFHDFDFDKIRAHTGITTESLFSEGRFKSLDYSKADFLIPPDCGQPMG